MRLYPPKILLALASALLLLWVLLQEHWGACQWPFRPPAVRRPNPLQNAAFLLELCAKWTVEPPFFFNTLRAAAAQVLLFSGPNFHSGQRCP